MNFFSDIKEVQNYLTSNASFTITRIKSHIRRAERKYLVRALGPALFRELADAYRDALATLETLSDEEKATIIADGAQYTLAPERYHEPLLFIQDAVANIAFMNGMGQLQMQIGDNGMRISTNENQKTAFQWQIDDLKYQVARDGFAAMDSLLEYLSANIDLFENWKQSEYYLEQERYFVKSADRFSQSYYLTNPYMTFVTLRYIMYRIEQFEVQRLISPAIFSRLKGKADYSDREKILIDNFLIPGIVLLTVAKGIVDKLIDVSDIGVQANLYTYYETLKDSRKRVPGSDDRNLMIEQLTKDGNEFLEQARNYLEANPDEFGEIEPEDSPMNFRITNSERKIFSM